MTDPLGLIGPQQRIAPDVAGPADSDSGMMVFFGGEFHQEGGTSAAAPFWAASLASVCLLLPADVAAQCAGE